MALKGYQIFPEKLAELREARGLTQEEMANGIGVAASTYGNWETPGLNGPSRRNFNRLAGFLKITREDLISKIGRNGSVSPRAVEDVDKLARKWARTLSTFTMHVPSDVQRRAIAVWKDLDADQVGKLVELLASERAPAPAFDPDRPLRSTVIDAKGNAKTEVEKMKPARRRARAG